MSAALRGRLLEKPPVRRRNRELGAVGPNLAGGDEGEAHGGPPKRRRPPRRGRQAVCDAGSVIRRRRVGNTPSRARVNSGHAHACSCSALVKLRASSAFARFSSMPFRKTRPLLQESSVPAFPPRSDDTDGYPCRRGNRARALALRLHRPVGSGFFRKTTFLSAGCRKSKR